MVAFSCENILLTEQSKRTTSLYRLGFKFGQFRQIKLGYCSGEIVVGDVNLWWSHSVEDTHFVCTTIHYNLQPK